MGCCAAYRDYSLGRLSRKISEKQALILGPNYEIINTGKGHKGMKLKERIEQLGASGYILLWLLGVPIPILFLFFLLRGCT